MALENRNNMKVKIRKNKNSKNRSTLYLAPYVNGKEGYVKIDLHIYTKPTNAIEREHNKETMLRAEVLRVKLENELQEQQTGIISKNSTKVSLFEFIKQLIREAKNQSRRESLSSALAHLTKFSKGVDIKLRDFDEDMLLKFKAYLESATCLKNTNRIKVNSKAGYFRIVKLVLNQAKFRKLISYSPSIYVKEIKMQEIEKQYLTSIELKKMKDAFCKSTDIKKAFLFCCLTGLRFSDVTRLKWNDIQFSQDEGMWKINFRQKKTGGLQYHPVDESAINILGKILYSQELIFPNLRYNNLLNKYLREWAQDAGINKHLTFHSSRHTYGTLLVSNGEDIYTVKEMMGHKDIKTTQVYAKVLSHQKNTAAARLGGII